MKLTQRISAAWSVFKSGSSPTVQAFLRGDEFSNRGASLTSGFEQSTWVYAAVNALAKNVSQIPFRIVQGNPDDENILQKGAVVDLFKRPHEFIDRFQFWELLVIWLMLRGEAFVVALDQQDRVLSTRNAGARHAIAKLLILSPDRFWHIIQDGTLQGWRYTGMDYNEPPMASQLFLPEEVMQLRLPNPFLFWRGMAPLSVALLAASTDYASAQFMKGLMLNNADTGVIVTTDQQPSAEQRETILAALRDRKRQAGTADRPLFLSGGAKIEKPTVSSADLQFLENRKLNRLEIGSVFGVPATVMGFSEDANRAVAGQERLSFIEQSILPLCSRLEAFIEPVVRSFDKNFSGRFHADSLPIMQQARRDRGEAATKFFGMGVPLNDITKMFALGLPKYSWGDTGYLPANLQPAGAAPTTSSPVPDDSSSSAPYPKSLQSVDGMLQILATVKSATPQHATRNPHPASVRAKKGKLSKLFIEQRVRVLSRLEKYYAQARITPEHPIDELFDLAAENEELLAKLRPLQLADAKDANLSEEAATEFVAAREKHLIAVNQFTFDALKASLHEGLLKSETLAQLTNRVKEIFQTAADPRAEMIAVNETQAAFNDGKLSALQKIP